MYLQQGSLGLNAEDQYNKSEINKFVKAEKEETRQRGWEAISACISF